jgi:hypothetical protein
MEGNLFNKLRRRLTYANVMATAAVFLSLGGGAYAAFKLPKNSVGTEQIKNAAVTTKKLKNGAVTASTVARNSLTGRQVQASTLGTVPNATHAATADSATNASLATTADSATNADHATNADELGGSPASSYQTRVTGTCTAGAGIAHVNADGSVGCANVQFYSGRLVEPLGGFDDTFVAIPGVAHVVVLNCSSSDANAELMNDSGGTTDLWYNSDSGYLGTGWIGDDTSSAATAGATWHLGKGSGTGAQVITITVTTEATGSNCIFQGTAQVITAT